eukprot:5763774-Prymnesium_polylepis.1
MWRTGRRHARPRRRTARDGARHFGEGDLGDLLGERRRRPPSVQLCTSRDCDSGSDERGAARRDTACAALVFEN